MSSRTENHPYMHSPLHCVCPKAFFEPISDLPIFSNRRGHYQRPLEEAIQSHSSQWPVKWSGKNPLHGGGNFTKMSPAERVHFSFPFFNRENEIVNYL